LAAENGFMSVQKRAAEITDRLRRAYGTIDIAVDLVRQVREE
jgi:hypothetical protein